ncbi:hypothetical protein DUI87_21253 [Hirundo rustica rustica]|uniref:Uncharacterized protein n=1 Tax=Hirundo rustica rustica TaxID=333673 RepID=A0A3M0JP80_HIRRU|nr:hypothetical protein DUI87_21253 [Hirundo rustica rustica]
MPWSADFISEPGPSLCAEVCLPVTSKMLEQPDRSSLQGVTSCHRLFQLGICPQENVSVRYPMQVVSCEHRGGQTTSGQRSSSSNVLYLLADPRISMEELGKDTGISQMQPFAV